MNKHEKIDKEKFWLLPGIGRMTKLVKSEKNEKKLFSIFRLFLIENHE